MTMTATRQRKGVDHAPIQAECIVDTAYNVKKKRKYTLQLVRDDGGRAQERTFCDRTGSGTEE